MAPRYRAAAWRESSVAWGHPWRPGLLPAAVQPGAQARPGRMVRMVAFGRRSRAARILVTFGDLRPGPSLTGPCSRGLAAVPGPAPHGHDRDRHDAAPEQQPWQENQEVIS